MAEEKKKEEYRVITHKSGSSQGWRMTREEAEKLRESMIENDGFDASDVEVAPMDKQR